MSEAVLKKKLKKQYVSRLRVLLGSLYQGAPAEVSEPQIFQLLYTAVKNFEWIANGFLIISNCSTIYVPTELGFEKAYRQSLSVNGKSVEVCALPKDFIKKKIQLKKESL